MSEQSLPQGDRVMDRWRHPELSDILLEPGEEAYIMDHRVPS
jgi:hypothetical protein